MKATLIAAFGLFASYNVYSSQKSAEMSDMALANVEALADNEANGPCFGYGSVLCTYNNIWVNYQK